MSWQPLDGLVKVTKYVLILDLCRWKGRLNRNTLVHSTFDQLKCKHDGSL